MPSRAAHSSSRTGVPPDISPEMIAALKTLSCFDRVTRHAVPGVAPAQSRASFYALAGGMVVASVICRWLRPRPPPPRPGGPGPADRARRHRRAYHPGSTHSLHSLFRLPSRRIARLHAWCRGRGRPRGAGRRRGARSAPARQPLTTFLPLLGSRSRAGDCSPIASAAVCTPRRACRSSPRGAPWPNRSQYSASVRGLPSLGAHSGRGPHPARGPAWHHGDDHRRS